MFAWDDLKLLSLVDGARSLKGLGETLNVDPTTVSRRMSSLESSLGLSLFRRSHGAVGLTEEGRQLLPHVLRMEHAGAAIGRVAGNLRDAPGGVVRISAPPTISRHVLAPRLGDLFQRSPKVSVDLEMQPANVGVETWEADIAVRVGPLNDISDRLLIRKLGTIDYAVFASDKDTGSSGWIAYSEQYAHLPEAKWVEQALKGQRPALRSNDPELLAIASAAGAGKSVLPVSLGSRQPGLRQTGEVVFNREVWSLRNKETGEFSSIALAYEWLLGVFAQPL